MIAAQPANGADEVDRFECASKQSAAFVPSNALVKFTNAELEKLSSNADGSKGRAATRVLAERYERGVGVAADFGKALELYRRAAFVQPEIRGIYTPGFGSVAGSVTMVGSDAPITVGDSIALARLGELYRDGIGVPRDMKRAQAFHDCSELIGPKNTSNSMSNESSYFNQFTKPRSAPIPQADSALLDRQIASLDFSSNVTGLAWSPDGKYLAVYYDRGDRLDFVRVTDGRHLWTVEKDWGVTTSKERVLQFSSDGQRLYLSAPIGKSAPGSKQHEVLAVVSTADGHPVHIVSDEAPAPVFSHALAVAAEPGKNRLFAVGGGAFNKVAAYDLASWNRSDIFGLSNEQPEWGHGFTSSRLAIDPQRDILWWAHEGTVEALKLSNASTLNQIHAFNVAVDAMQVNPRSGELVAGGSADFYSYRYPLTDPKAEIRTYHDDPATLVRAFDSASGRQTRTYVGPGGSVEGLSVSADGKFVAAARAKIMGASSSYVLLWDAESGKLLSSKDCESANVGDAAFDPTGTKLAYAIDRKIHIVNLSQ